MDGRKEERKERRKGGKVVQDERQEKEGEGSEGKQETEGKKGRQERTGIF
jgi:hypothetical protein